VGQTRGRRTRRSRSGVVRPDGTATQRHFPLPRSLANVKRESSEKKRQDAKSWTRKKLGRTGNRKYRPSDKQKPDPVAAIGPPVAEDKEGAASEASEWEARDQAERFEEMRAEEMRLGEV